MAAMGDVGPPPIGILQNNERESRVDVRIMLPTEPFDLLGRNSMEMARAMTPSSAGEDGYRTATVSQLWRWEGWS